MEIFLKGIPSQYFLSKIILKKKIDTNYQIVMRTALDSSSFK